VWDLNFDPARAHASVGSESVGSESAGSRSDRTFPALILSEDIFNEGPAGLLVVVPISRARRKIRWHVPLAPPEGGLRAGSFIQCENVRSVSTQRLKRRRGRVSPPLMRQVEDRVRILLGL